MEFALKDKSRVIATQTGDRASCPACGGEVVAKCGSIVIHHWAHKVADCDPWSEPEGPWHRAWKAIVAPSAREVVIGNHRADIVGNSGRVVELQHSPISPETIADREQFYGRMVWLFDASGWVSSLRYPGIRPRYDAKAIVKVPASLELYQFDVMGLNLEWPRARKTIITATKPQFWDFGGCIVYDPMRQGYVVAPDADYTPYVPERPASIFGSPSNGPHHYEWLLPPIFQVMSFDTTPGFPVSVEGRFLTREMFIYRYLQAVAEDPHKYPARVEAARVYSYLTEYRRIRRGMRHAAKQARLRELKRQEEAALARQKAAEQAEKRRQDREATRERLRGLSWSKLMTLVQEAKTQGRWTGTWTAERLLEVEVAQELLPAAKVIAIPKTIRALYTLSPEKFDIYSKYLSDKIANKAWLKPTDWLASQLIAEVGVRRRTIRQDMERALRRRELELLRLRQTAPADVQVQAEKEFEEWRQHWKAAVEDNSSESYHHPTPPLSRPDWRPSRHDNGGHGY